MLMARRMNLMLEAFSVIDTQRLARLLWFKRNLPGTLPPRERIFDRALRRYVHPIIGTSVDFNISRSH